MTVLETIERSQYGNSTRYVIAVTRTTIKTVDSNGYVYYYCRDNGKLKYSAQSSQVAEDRILAGLAMIENYVGRHGYPPVLLARFIWNGGLRPYLNTDSTINPQWKRENGASIGIKAIKGLRIKKMRDNLYL